MSSKCLDREVNQEGTGIRREVDEARLQGEAASPETNVQPEGVK